MRLRSAILCAAVGLVMTGGHARAASYAFKTSTTGNWNVAANWQTGIIPTSADTAGSNNGANATIDSNDGTVLDVRWANSANVSSTLNMLPGGSLSTAATGIGFTVGRSNGATGTVNMSGGSLTTLAGATGDSSGLLSIGDLINASGFATGNFNVSGGTVTVGNNYNIGSSNNFANLTPPVNPATVFSIGVVNQTGGDINVAGAVNLGLSGKATYTMSAGTLTQAGTNAVGSSLGHDAFFIARNRFSTGSFTQSGSAVVTIKNGLFIATGNNTTGSYTISGGTLNLTGQLMVGASVNDGGGAITGNTGSLSIIGNQASPITANLLQADTAGSTLNFSIDSDSGTTPLNLVPGTVNTTAFTGNAVLNAATQIDVDNISGFMPTPFESFTLLTAAGGINTLPTLVHDGDIFDFATLSIVTNGDGSQSLVATVPEPATFSALGLVAVTALRRRRK